MTANSRSPPPHRPHRRESAIVWAEELILLETSSDRGDRPETSPVGADEAGFAYESLQELQIGLRDRTADLWVHGSGEGSPAATESAEIRRDLRKFITGSPPRRTLDELISGLSKFDRPVLVLWATEDRMFPVELAHRLVKIFRDARLVEIADSWTLLPEDQPEQTAAALESFVAE